MARRGRTEREREREKEVRGERDEKKEGGHKHRKWHSIYFFSSFILIFSSFFVSASMCLISSISCCLNSSPSNCFIPIRTEEKCRETKMSVKTCFSLNSYCSCLYFKDTFCFPTTIMCLMYFFPSFLVTFSSLFSFHPIPILFQFWVPSISMRFFLIFRNIQQKCAHTK